MKMNALNLKKGIVAFFAIFSTGFISYAGEPVTASIGSDIVSTYLWRGQKLDDAAIQPSMSLDWGGFSVGAWGSVGLQGDYKEVDLSLAYTVGGFTVVATDYYCADSYSNYFVYDSDTPHVLELGASYDFGPVALSWYSNLLGATGCNDKGEKALSSYFEVSAPFSLGGLDWSAAIGATPFANDFYGADGFAVTNISLSASKEVEFAGITVPAFVSLMANPRADKLFMTVGISF